jgi:hypothetical protein
LTRKVTRSPGLWLVIALRSCSVPLMARPSASTMSSPALSLPSAGAPGMTWVTLAPDGSIL